MVIDELFLESTIESFGVDLKWGAVSDAVVKKKIKYKRLR